MTDVTTLGGVLSTFLPPSALLTAYGQGLAILALGLAGALLLKSRPAASALLLLLGLLGGVTAPLLDAVLPDVRLPVLPPVVGTMAPGTATACAGTCAEASSRPSRRGPASLRRASSATPDLFLPDRPQHPLSTNVTNDGAATRSPSIGRASWLAILLLTGTAAGVAHQAAQLASLRRLSREASPLDDEAWREDLHGARRRLDIHRPVYLVMHPELFVPMTWGFLRPVIAMPAAAAGWCRERRLAVLLHELAHVRRADWLALHLARLTCGIYWANPVAWWATARLVQAQELACDRLVVESGLRPSAYAGHLVHIAREARARSTLGAAGVAAVRSSHMEVRVMSILAPISSSPARRLATAGAGLVLGLLLVAATAAVAMLHPVPSVAGSPGSSLLSLPTRSLVAAVAPLPPAGPAAFVQQPVEDGGELDDDLRALATQLGAIERRLDPLADELRGAETKLRPYEAQIRALELEARAHEKGVREVESAIHGTHSALEEKLREAEEAIRPHQRRLLEVEESIHASEERIRSIEREMRPLQQEMEERSEALGAASREAREDLARELEALHRRMEPIHERMQSLHRELEPRFAEIERVHQAMEPAHERMESLHRELELVGDRLETAHRELEPIQHRMEAVHEQMRPVHEEMERIHRRMEPIHRELEAVHRRVERALRGELRDLLEEQLGPGVPLAALESAAARAAEVLSMNISNGWLRVRGSAPELRDEITNALRAAGSTADSEAVAAAVEAILELEVRIPTGRE
ncbi:MAG TPA: M56 family metallopeptidase [Thermoanaerobaculia bacterium]|nr:M56 family metallopeptidase [Thermoanaerobaculia bacterium]